MPSDTQQLVTDRAMALKAVIQYLLNSGRGSVSLNEIRNLHPRAKCQATQDDELLETIRSFMRFNASSKIYEQEYENMRSAVQRLFDARDIALPRHFLDSAEHAGLSIKRQKRPRGVPSFVDCDAIIALTGGLTGMKTLVRQYEGYWRVFRMSSSYGNWQSGGANPKSNDAKLSVGLLHIKPFDLLRQEGLSIPEFSLYQRPEDLHDAVRTYGIFVHMGPRLTLLAEGPRIGSGISDIGLMTWHHVETIGSRGHSRPPISGVYCLPNSDGQRVVASYFCGVFVEGSDKHDQAAYEEVRRREIAEKRIGTVERGRLEEMIPELADDQQTRETIDRLIDRSSEPTFRV